MASNNQNFPQNGKRPRMEGVDDAASVEDNVPSPEVGPSESLIPADMTILEQALKKDIELFSKAYLDKRRKIATAEVTKAKTAQLVEQNAVPKSMVVGQSVKLPKDCVDELKQLEEETQTFQKKRVAIMAAARANQVRSLEQNLKTYIEDTKSTMKKKITLIFAGTADENAIANFADSWMQKTIEGAMRVCQINLNIENLNLSLKKDAESAQQEMILEEKENVMENKNDSVREIAQEEIKKFMSTIKNASSNANKASQQGQKQGNRKKGNPAQNFLQKQGKKGEVKFSGPGREKSVQTFSPSAAKKPTASSHKKATGKKQFPNKKQQYKQAAQKDAAPADESASTRADKRKNWWAKNAKKGKNANQN